MIMGLFNDWIVVVLMMCGLYIVIAHGNLIKKIVGLTIFQTSVFIFYISMANVDGGTAPILADDIVQYSNPLPHVLILTAIVVGLATTALALSLVVRIKEAYGSIEEEEIQQQDNQIQEEKIERDSSSSYFTGDYTTDGGTYLLILKACAAGVDIFCVSKWRGLFDQHFVITTSNGFWNDQLRIGGLASTLGN